MPYNTKKSPLPGIPRVGLSPAEVAWLLSMPIRTVYYQMDQHQIPTLQLGERLRRIPAAWLRTKLAGAGERLDERILLRPYASEGSKRRKRRPRGTPSARPAPPVIDDRY